MGTQTTKILSADIESLDFLNQATYRQQVPAVKLVFETEAPIFRLYDKYDLPVLSTVSYDPAATDRILYCGLADGTTIEIPVAGK